MAESDTLKLAAEAALRVLDSFGPDQEQDDDELIEVRAQLRHALGSDAAS